MTINDLSDTAPWRAAVVADFASSELFARTFEEGMDLVEETAGEAHAPSPVMAQFARLKTAFGG